MPIKKGLFKFLNILYFAFTGFLLFLLLCNLHVYLVSKPLMYDEIGKLPYNQVGMVPGTSKFLRNGKKNPYFTYRLEAASYLFFSGKIKYILVSGDNKRMNYNEPFMMRKALLKLGVPAKNIIIDYAGFRTLDSVVRSKEVFGQRRFVIISQPFQNRRAVFIARKRGIDAIAYNAKDVESIRAFKIRSRELLARVMAVVDIYVLKTQPYFLGDPVIIE